MRMPQGAWGMRLQLLLTLPETEHFVQMESAIADWEPPFPIIGHLQHF